MVVRPWRSAQNEAQRKQPERKLARTIPPLRGFLPLILLLAAWQIFGNDSSPYYPRPSTWYDAVKPLTVDGELGRAVWTTFYSFIVGLAIAIVIGTVLGVAAGSSRNVDKATGPTFEFLRVLPAAALVPLATLVLGYTMLAKLVIVVLVTIWPILLNCRAARRSMSATLSDVPRTLRLSRVSRFRKVLVPALIPSVFLGTRIAAPLALIITLLFELVTSINGLGSLLTVAQANFNSKQVYGLLVIAGVLGFLVNQLVTVGESVASRRMTGATGSENL